jgi:hypothetical protein
MKRLEGLLRCLLAPLRDLLTGLELLLGGGIPALVLVFVGLAIGWWIYVPVHELLHVAGCLLSGGTVETLEVAPLYGGALLARIFSFVEAGGDYAGRLSDFEANGTLGYLATDLAPYLLALFPGYAWLRLAARRRGRGWALGWGAGLPFALAPLLSLTGDAYEIGSLIVTSLPPFAAMRENLVSDDVILLLRTGVASDQVPAFALAVLVAVVWACSTVWLSARLATLLGQPPLEQPHASTRLSSPSE